MASVYDQHLRPPGYERSTNVLPDELVLSIVQPLNPGKWAPRLRTLLLNSSSAH